MRFKLTEAAQVQRTQSGVPFWVLEKLVQPGLAGSRLLSARELRGFEPARQLQASKWLGLFVCCDGAGTVTSIGQMRHRLACAAQEPMQQQEPIVAARVEAMPRTTLRAMVVN
ncbi:hypothetical protein [Chitinolyticbacter albus]|uniref:hypothetical protein n=1 Tax=Chitinolyticbacter albus TaxID=2961951 RepID=UPI00210D01E6|nr:hypothetical protein [Chitinolyticbacter albus]